MVKFLQTHVFILYVLDVEAASGDLDPGGHFVLESGEGSGVVHGPGGSGHGGFVNVLLPGLEEHVAHGGRRWGKKGFKFWVTSTLKFIFDGKVS